MSAEPITLVGTTFAVCQALPATMDAAGFETLEFIQAKGVRSLSDIGKVHQTRPDNPFGAKFSKQKRVGYSNGALILEMFKITDPGQALLAAAVDDANDYSFMITLNDGSKLLCTGQASSYIHGLGDAKQARTRKITVEITSDIIEVDAVTV